MHGNKYFLDTNIFLRVVVKDDMVKALECERLFQLMTDGVVKSQTTHLVLAEFVWTLKSFYQVQKQDIVRLVDGIMGMKNLQIREHFDTVQMIEHHRNSQVKFIDALIASDSFFKNKDACIVSYDKDFDTLGIPRYEPAELMSLFKA